MTTIMTYCVEMEVLGSNVCITYGGSWVRHVDLC